LIETSPKARIENHEKLLLLLLVLCVHRFLDEHRLVLEALVLSTANL